MGVALALAGLCRGSQESAAVLAAVPVAGGLDSSTTCSRFVRVRSSFGGGREVSVSAGMGAGAGAGAGTAWLATGVVSSAVSAGAGSGCTGFGAACGSAVFGCLGVGAGLGTACCLNMLAHVLAAGAAGLGASTGADLAAGAVVLGSVFSALGLLLSQAEDSSVGTESCWFSLLRAPLVLACVVRPRAAAPPRPPRSEPRPRPRPPSETARPPRAARAPEPVDSAVVVVVDAEGASLDLTLGAFFGFETSSHCATLPRKVG